MTPEQFNALLASLDALRGSVDRLTAAVESSGGRGGGIDARTLVVLASAAAAAVLGPDVSFRVRSITPRRVGRPAGVSAWAAAGRAGIQGSHNPTGSRTKRSR